MKLKVLDVVRTKFGTLAVVESVTKDGRVSLVLPSGTLQKIAWYEPAELQFVASVKNLVSAAETVV